jgi:hypothetical protein
MSNPRLKGPYASAIEIATNFVGFIIGKDLITSKLSMNSGFLQSIGV